MQSLNKKERKLMELQITQTRHPKSVADGRSVPITKPAFARDTGKKGHNSVKILQMTSLFKLDLYFMMIYPSVNFE